MARMKTHLALQDLRDDLERRIEERTADLERANEVLSAANEQLRRESEQREQAEGALKDRLRFEQLLSDLSARFVNIPPEQVDSEIEQGLKQLLEFFQIDRAGLLRAAPDKTTFQITHACLANGIPPVPLREALPTALFPWAFQKLLMRHEVVSIATLDEMPVEANIDLETYKAWHIRSHLNIPIVVTGSEDYIIAINAVRNERTWPEEYIPRLRLLGEIFANALERQHAQGVLHESEARFRQMADASPIMIWMSGLDRVHLPQ
jgi:GAF domain-containing protein